MKTFSEYNPKTKRAIVVLSIIALLILIAGLISYSVQFLQDEPPTLSNGKEAISPGTDAPSGVIVDIDNGENKQLEDSGGGKGNNIDTAKDYPSEPTGKPTKPYVPMGKPTPPPVKPIAPVPPVKPADPPIQPTDPPKLIEPPEKPSGGGSGSGGGSVSYPAAVVEIIAPDFSYIDNEFEVKSTQRNVKTISWAVTEDGKNTQQSDFLKGTLEKSGGRIIITKPGNYNITVTVKNHGGSTYIFSKEIMIYPTLDIVVEADKNAHADKVFAVTTTLSDNVKQQLSWHIFKDGKELKWQDAVTGTLTNTGGSIQIKEHGSYTLTATAFDETSREFSGKAEVVVYPVIALSLQAPTATHADTTVAVTATTKDLGDLKLVWTVTKDDKTVPVSDCAEGTLNNSGGSLRFKEKGRYILTATATDKAGRAFTTKADITIYPVATFSFDLPATTHTDTPVTVAVKSSELQDMVAEWTVIYNGKIVKPSAVLNGNLTNTGGSIRFTQKGNYTIKATLFDKLGREYSHEAKTVVYPIAETGFYLPPQTHTDTTVEVKTNFKDADNLTAVWSLTKNGKPIPLADGFEGTITDDGGKIRFKEVGKYELKATITDETGRSFTYTAPTAVYPVITVTLELPKETHTDRPAKASAKAENGGLLPIEWNIVKNGVAAPDDAYLNDTGTILFKEKGLYTVTTAVTDETGRSFSASKTISVYPIPTMAIALPADTHTDDSVEVTTILTDMENLTAVWYVDNTEWNTYADGTLANGGGSLHFKHAGVYELQARVTDSTGREFRFNSKKIEVLPVLNLTFDLPDTGHTDTQIDVLTRGNNNVLLMEWDLMKNGQPVPIAEVVNGSLNAQGGKIRFNSAGEYRLTATMIDALGRTFSHSEKITIYQLYNCAFTMPSTVHAGQNFVVAMSNSANLGGKPIEWTAKKDGQSIAVSVAFNGSLTNNGGTVHVNSPGNYMLTATITDELGRVFAHEQTITITNVAPNKPTITADVTRTAAAGKYLVNLTVESSDAEDDEITYEYEGKAADDYYAVGTHTVRVRAKDNFGGVSDWSEVTFTVTNSAPSMPTITINHGNSDTIQNNPVTITASSTDPNGDHITYIWEGRPDETYVYAAGKHTIRVKAVDSAGIESPWSAVQFFVANENGVGGILMTKREFAVIEDGIDGATITGYSLFVTPVEEHNDQQDYATIKGYNKYTNQWERINSVYPGNGVYMTGTLPSDTYTKFAMTYVSQHSCMSNKAYFQYTLNYSFE